MVDIDKLTSNRPGSSVDTGPVGGGGEGGREVDDDSDGDSDEDVCPICGQPYVHKREYAEPGVMKTGHSIRSDAEVCKTGESHGGERTMYVHLPNGSSGESGPGFPFSDHNGTPLFLGLQTSDGPDWEITDTSFKRKYDDSDGDETDVEGAIEQAFTDGDDVVVVYECGKVRGYDAALQRMARSNPGVTIGDAAPRLDSKCPDEPCDAHIERVEYREDWV